jgi:cytochrome P450
MRRRFGDLFTVRALNGTVVMGCTPALARQVFSADPSTFRAFAVGALGPILGEQSLLVSSGEPHRRQRKLLQPPFHGARMRAYGQAMQQVAAEYIDRLRPGQELRAHDLTTSISIDVILRTVFGVGGATLEQARTLLRDVLAGFSPLLVFSPRTHHPLFPPWRRLRRSQAAYEVLIEKLVSERRASGEHGEDILGMLLAATWEDGAPLTTAEIRDQLLTLLVAGHETTAISLAWATHDLYTQPAVLERLRAELSPLGSSPEPEALARLPYLSGICDESLRLRPIVSDVLRTLEKPFEYGGYQLPAGVGVAVAIEEIHADPSIYPDPDTFRPERFLEKKPGPFEFLPFGGGHRRCIGAAFSDYEARLVLGTLAARLDLQPLGLDRRVRRNVTMGPERGVPVRVVRRLDG